MPEAPAAISVAGGAQEPVAGEEFRGFLDAGEFQECGTLPPGSFEAGGEGFGGKRAAGL